MQQVEIRIKGQINERWSEWFGCLTISQLAPGETILTGRVQDVAALYGIISRLRDLGLKLTSLSAVEVIENQNESARDETSFIAPASFTR